MNIEEELSKDRKALIHGMFPHAEDTYANDSKYTWNTMNEFVRSALENYHFNHVKPLMDTLVKSEK